MSIQTSPNVVSVEIERDILREIKWLTEKLTKQRKKEKGKGVTASIAIRHALAVDALILDKLEQGGKILVERKDGTTAEIQWEDIDKFEQNFS